MTTGTTPPRMAGAARVAGVSKMIVSRVLAGGSISPETRARVQEAIDALGYAVMAAAGTLSSGRSELVAALAPSLANSNFADTVRGLSDALASHSLQLLLGGTNYHLDREEAPVRSLLRHQPRGIALTGRHHSPGTRALLERAGIPIVEMWGLPKHPIDRVVGLSNAKASPAMLHHLHQRGYRCIGFLCGASGLDRRGTGHMRGYMSGIRAFGLGEPRVIRLSESLITMSYGGPAMATLLDAWPDTDAVMCVSDMSAFGTIMERHRRGLSVPGDIAVAGFGNFEIAWCCHPTITATSADAYGIGLHTGEVLLNALGVDGATSTRKPSRTDFSVVERKSA